MLALINLVALAQAIGQTPPPGAWSLETPKAAPAVFTYAESAGPIVQMTCQPASGQVVFQVAMQRRVATKKSGVIWTNAIGLPAPWPASVTLNSGGTASTLRGEVDANSDSGASRAVVEASTKAPFFRVFAKTGVLAFTIMGETVGPAPANPGDVRKFLRVCG